MNLVDAEYLASLIQRKKLLFKAAKQTQDMGDNTTLCLAMREIQKEIRSQLDFHKTRRREGIDP